MKTSNSNAPGQYLGYSVQSYRMCIYLFRYPENTNVALEVFDDVSTIDNDGSVIAEQTKSGLTHNPVSNWSVDLWKTLSNWVNAISSGSLSLENTFFKLYVVQVYSGEFVTNLSDAKDDVAIDRVLEEIFERFKSENPKGCEKYLENFYSASVAVKRSIIKKFSYECGEGEALYSGLRQLMVPWVSAEMIENACKHAVGWVKIKTDELIAAGQPAVVSVGDFLNDFRSYVRKHDRDYILATFSGKPHVDEVNAKINDLPTFIRQLDLIQSESDEKVRAMSDYLQSVSEKTIWSKRGLVFKESFDELEENLISDWRNKKEKIEITQPALTDILKGKLIYIEAKDRKYRLEEKDLPYFFSKGTLHSLADRLLLGWHPNYKTALELNDD